MQTGCEVAYMFIRQCHFSLSLSLNNTCYLPVVSKFVVHEETKSIFKVEIQ